jgi:hypothetical protein
MLRGVLGELPPDPDPPPCVADLFCCDITMALRDRADSTSPK